MINCRKTSFLAAAVTLWMSALGPAQAQDSVPRLSNGHPNLSGNWLGRAPRGSTNKPSYKAEYAGRVRELGGRREFEDPTYDCGHPGFPRAGAPQKIIHTPGEVVFLYGTAAGMAWRIIPTDARALPEYNDPTLYGEAVGHWEGGTLVIEGQNYDASTWLGARGDDGSNPPGPGDAYFHSEEMRTIERIRYDAENLVYDVTVTDPFYLTEPWEMDTITLRRSAEAPIEPPRCVAISPAEYGFGE